MYEISLSRNPISSSARFESLSQLYQCQPINALERSLPPVGVEDGVLTYIRTAKHTQGFSGWMIQTTPAMTVLSERGLGEHRTADACYHIVQSRPSESLTYANLCQDITRLLTVSHHKDNSGVV